MKDGLKLCNEYGADKKEKVDIPGGQELTFRVRYMPISGIYGSGCLRIEGKPQPNLT